MTRLAGMTLSFDQAADKVKNLKGSPGNPELLSLYALYKQVLPFHGNGNIFLQGTVGDNSTSRPGMLDMKGKAKWDAWTDKKGVGQEDAKTQYVQLVEQLIEKYGVN